MEIHKILPYYTCRPVVMTCIYLLVVWALHVGVFHWQARMQNQEWRANCNYFNASWVDNLYSILKKMEPPRISMTQDNLCLETCLIFYIFDQFYPKQSFYNLPECPRSFFLLNKFIKKKHFPKFLLAL